MTKKSTNNRINPQNDDIPIASNTPKRINTIPERDFVFAILSNLLISIYIICVYFFIYKSHPIIDSLNRGVNTSHKNRALAGSTDSTIFGV